MSELVVARKPLPNTSQLSRAMAKFYPFESFRPHMLEVLAYAMKWLVELDKRVMIVQAPTGFGKQGFLLTLMRYFFVRHRVWSYYLTPELTLLTQIVNDADYVRVVKGKSNFMCDEESVRADNAPCNDPKYRCEAECAYKLQRDAASVWPYVASTTSYMLRATKNPYVFAPRGLVLIDEAQSLENEMRSLVSATLTQRDWLVLRGSPTLPTIEDVDDWVRVMPQLVQAFELRAELTNADAGSEENVELERLRAKLANISLILSEPEACVIRVVRGKRKYSLEFSTANVSLFGDDILDRLGDKLVFVSATILNPKQFLRDFSRMDEDVLFVDVEESSIHDRRRSPVVIDAVASLSFKHYEKSISKINKRISEICEANPNVKRCIIPSSHKLRKNIYTHLRRKFGDLVLTCAPGDIDVIINCPTCNMFNSGESTVVCRRCGTAYHIRKRDQVTAEYMDGDKPYIGVFTHFARGVDLRGDRCRVLVVPKIPYPNFMNDKVLLRRLQSDEREYREEHECDYKPGEVLCSNWKCDKPCMEYYNRKTVEALVQMAGRAQRGADDWCKIHILDKAWGNFYDRNYYLFPKWFRELIE